jgi:hypothetical protein
MFRALFFCVIVSVIAHLCVQISYSADSSIEYEDPEGVVVNFNEDGTLRSIKASAEVAVNSNDRDEINDAKREAKLIAKAEITKFLSERINTVETVESMTGTINKKSSGQSVEATREKVKIQTMKIHSSADQYLKGVVTLLEDVDVNRKIVRIEVGINEKTMKAADSVKQQIKTNSAESQSPSDNNNQPSGREIKKSKMRENF